MSILIQRCRTARGCSESERLGLGFLVKVVGGSSDHFVQTLSVRRVERVLQSLCSLISTSGGEKGERRTLAQDQKRKMEQRITASPKGNQAPVGIFFKLAPKNNPSTYIYVVSPILEGKK